MCFNDRHLYELSIMKGRLGLLYLKWDKREIQGQNLINKAKTTLSSFKNLPSKILLSQTIQYPLLYL